MATLKLSKDGKKVLGFSGKNTEDKLSIPEGIEAISNQAFSGHKEIKNVKLPKSLRIIGGSAFRKTGIQKVTLPQALESIGEMAFTYLTKAKAGYSENIEVPAEIKIVKGNLNFYTDGRCLYENTDAGFALRLCFKHGLTKLELDDGIVSIKSGAFPCTPYLHELSLPDSLVSIETKALDKLPLERLFIPAGVESLGEGELSYLTSNVLTKSGYHKSTEISVDPGNQIYAAEGGFFIRNGSDGRTLLHQFGRPDDEFVIPQGITDIGPSVFSCHRFKIVEIPEGVKKIEKCSFEKGDKLTEIFLPASLTDIGANTFGSCPKLREVHFKNSDIRIDDLAFENCELGKMIFYCDEGSSAAEYAQNHGVNLPTVQDGTEKEINPHELFRYKIGKDHTVKVLEYTGLLTDVKIPACIDGYPVTSFGKNVFRNNTVIQTASWPCELKELPAEMFFGCTSLHSVSLPDSLVSIGDKAFRNCVNLKSIEIPNSVQHIGDKAFECAENNWGCWFYHNSLEEMKGTLGTEAQRYAAENGIEFKPSCNEIEIDHIFKDYRFHDVENGISLDYVSENAPGCSSDVLVIPDEILGKPVIELSECFHKRPDFNQYNQNQYEELPSKLVIGVALQHIRCPLYDRGINEICISEENTNIVADDYVWYEDGGKVLVNNWRSSPEHFLLYTVREGTEVILPHALEDNDFYAGWFSFPESLREIGERSLKKWGWGGWIFHTAIGVPGSFADEYFSDQGVNFSDSRFTGKEAQLNGTAFKYHTENGYCILDRYLRPDPVLCFPETVEGLPVRVDDWNDFFPDPSLITSVTLSSVFTETDKIMNKGFLSTCSELQEIRVDDDNMSFTSVDDVLYSKDQSVLVKYPAHKNESLYNIPEGVVEISPYAFCNNTLIQEIVVPASVNKIGKGGFEGCSSLRIAELPDSLEVLPDSLFSGCSNFKIGRIPEKITEIGEYCFYGTAPECVKLPESVTSIGSYAFVSHSRTNRIENIELPKSVQSIGIGVCAGIKHITVYDRIESDVNYAGAYYGDESDTFNSHLGSIGWRMIDGIHRHTITVKSAESGKIKYEVLMYGHEEPETIYRAMFSSWGKHGEFNFSRIDEKFSKLKDFDNRFQTAVNRLKYPIGLSEEMKDKYLAWMRRNGIAIAEKCIEDNDISQLIELTQYGILSKRNIAHVIELSANQGTTEISAYLLEYQSKL